MRRICSLGIAIALVGLLPQSAQAQQGRHFENAWFWGLKGGAMVYQMGDAWLVSDQAVFRLSPTSSNRSAGSLGIDWMITRRRGGAYISFDQGFMDRQIVLARARGSDTTATAVDLQNLRRVIVAGMVFPPRLRWVRPYAGLGAAMMQVATADPRQAVGDEDAFLFDQMITEYRTQVTPVVILGGQAEVPYFSVFAQGTAIPTHDRSFLKSSNAFNFSFEIGLRYNVGSSIDRP
jgi:hypothetical protein